MSPSHRESISPRVSLTLSPSHPEPASPRVHLPVQEENVCDSEDALWEEPPGDQGCRVQRYPQVPEQVDDDQGMPLVISGFFCLFNSTFKKKEFN